MDHRSHPSLLAFQKLRQENADSYKASGVISEVKESVDHLYEYVEDRLNNLEQAVKLQQSVIDYLIKERKTTP